MDVGSRRPLLSSAGGVAMLIGLPQDEAEAVVAENVRRLGGPGNASVRALQRMLARSQALGYAFNQSETARGIHAFGVAVRDPRGMPFGVGYRRGEPRTTSPRREAPKLPPSCAGRRNASNRAQSASSTDGVITSR
jgi:hypothetical protein